MPKMKMMMMKKGILTTPTSGQILRPGSPLTITWIPRKNPKKKRLRISFSTNGGNTFTVIFPNVAYGLGTLDWEVPNQEVSNAVMKVELLKGMKKKVKVTETIDFGVLNPVYLYSGNDKSIVTTTSLDDSKHFIKLIVSDSNPFCENIGGNYLLTKSGNTYTRSGTIDLELVIEETPDLDELQTSNRYSYISFNYREHKINSLTIKRGSTILVEFIRVEDEDSPASTKSCNTTGLSGSAINIESGANFLLTNNKNIYPDKLSFQLSNIHFNQVSTSDTTYRINFNNRPTVVSSSVLQGALDGWYFGYAAFGPSGLQQLEIESGPNNIAFAGSLDIHPIYYTPYNIRKTVCVSLELHYLFAYSVFGCNYYGTAGIGVTDGDFTACVDCITGICPSCPTLCASMTTNAHVVEG